MKAVLMDGFGGPEVLYLGEADKPEPGEGQVLIEVAATSVNRPDIVQRLGNYPPPPGESDILGLEVAGAVAELGPGVETVTVGERVIALVGGGGYAEYATAHTGHVMRIPDAMTFERAACICETYITAYLNLFMLAGLADGETVLLHGGGGGVNTAGLQLCKALVPASRVIVTASPGKVERVRELGADLVIDYRSEDFAAAIHAYTDKAGCAVILDHIGGPLSRRQPPVARRGWAPRAHRRHGRTEGRIQPRKAHGQTPADHRLGAEATAGRRKSRNHRGVRSGRHAALCDRSYRAADPRGLPRRAGCRRHTGPWSRAATSASSCLHSEYAGGLTTAPCRPPPLQ